MQQVEVKKAGPRSEQAEEHCYMEQPMKPAHENKNRLVDTSQFMTFV